MNFPSEKIGDWHRYLPGWSFFSSNESWLHSRTGEFLSSASFLLMTSNFLFKSSSSSPSISLRVLGSISLNGLCSLESGDLSKIHPLRNKILHFYPLNRSGFSETVYPIFWAYPSVLTSFLIPFPSWWT